MYRAPAANYRFPAPKTPITVVTSPHLSPSQRCARRRPSIHIFTYYPEKNCPATAGLSHPQPAARTAVVQRDQCFMQAPPENFRQTGNNAARSALPLKVGDDAAQYRAVSACLPPVESLHRSFSAVSIRGNIPLPPPPLRPAPYGSGSAP